jgi:hypothetical protein
VWYLSFCAWLVSLSITSSRFIHIVAKVTNMDHVFLKGHRGCCRFLAIVTGAAVDTEDGSLSLSLSLSLSDTLIPLPLGTQPAQRVLGHIGVRFLLFQEPPICFPWCLYHFPFPLPMDYFSTLNNIWVTVLTGDVPLHPWRFIAMYLLACLLLRNVYSIFCPS